MKNQTKASIKIQSIWRSYRIRNLRKYMQIKKCNDCNIYTKLSPLATSELESKIFTCWNCFDIPRNPTITCIVDDNDIDGMNYMKKLYLKKKNNISRTPTATCIIDNNDVNINVVRFFSQGIATKPKILHSKIKDTFWTELTEVAPALKSFDTLQTSKKEDIVEEEARDIPHFMPRIPGGIRRSFARQI